MALKNLIIRKLYDPKVILVVAKEGHVKIFLKVTADRGRKKKLHLLEMFSKFQVF